MKAIHIFICLILFGFVFILTDSPQAAAQDQAPQSATLKRLTPEAFKDIVADMPPKELGLEGLTALQAAGQVVLLDLRGEDSFRHWHLQGAVNIPLTDLTAETLAARLPDKTVPVVLVCDYSLQPIRRIALSWQGWPVLRDAGYDDLHMLNLWQGPPHRALEDIEKLLPVVKQPAPPSSAE